MKTSILTFCLVTIMILAKASSADAPSRMIDSRQQAIRDQEKLQILETELKEQRELSAQLSQQRAIALNDKNQNAVNETDARLTEVTNNIRQIEQEISMAQGKTAKTPPAYPEPASIRVSSNNSNNSIEIQPSTAARKWWDFYQQGH